MTRIKPITELTVEEVATAYSGRPGCGCGCRGTHYVNPMHREQITQILNILKSRAGEVQVEELLDEPGLVYYLESTRFYWVFVYH